MQPKIDLPYAAPLLDAVALFERLGISYALVGGIAAMFYGRPRFTEDVDFVAMSGHREILDKNPESMREHHFDPSCSWKLYHDSGIEIDIWKDDFSNDIVRRAIDTPLAGRTVRLIEMHDLIAMKLRAGRLQDDSDVAEIIKNQRVDPIVLQALVTAEQLAHFGEVEARAERERG